MGISIGSFVLATEPEIEELYFKKAFRGNNDSPYDTKYGTGNFKKAPNYIYFYRIYLNQNRLAVDHYYWHRGNANDDFQTVAGRKPITPRGNVIGTDDLGIEDALATIAKLAASGNAEWKSKTGKDFEDPYGSRGLLWTIRSYISFMIDDDAWEILKVQGKPAITFENEDTATGRKGNHSFYDAFETTVDVGGGKMRNIVCFINHMKKDKQGNDHMGPAQNDARQNFKFNLFALVKLDGWNNDAGSDRKVIVMIDPPGGNEGPPDPP